jgi:hypothetical protein
MLLLRREYSDGPESPELVLLHYAILEEGAGDPHAGASLVMPSAGGDGRREVSLFLPEAAPGRSLALRYRYSTILGGHERFSPAFDLDLASAATTGEAIRLEEADPGNLRPAAGRGMFRLLLPARSRVPDAQVRYGFGAMRKKPSPELCRLTVPTGGGTPVIEAPEALSVLKARPMPYFLYHVDPADGQLRQDKIAPARITFADDSGDVVAARMLWGDPAWGASNLTVMEVKNFGGGALGAAGHFFAEDPAAFAAERQRALAALPLPRVFEGYLAGPSGTEAEYCLQLVRRRDDGSLAVEWRNREGGGNWRITL